LVPELLQFLIWIEEHIETIEHKETIRVRSANRPRAIRRYEREKYVTEDSNGEKI
jgi:hypothetical protein